jgi:hypothetical protein
MEEYVYILQLEDKCWYVGWTLYPQKRITQHFAKTGAKWTKTHHPMAVFALFVGDKKLEKQITLEMMKLFGIDNVRGGPWCQRTLNFIRPELSILVEKTKIQILLYSFFI